jgi:hypothetical protein
VPRSRSRQNSVSLPITALVIVTLLQPFLVHGTLQPDTLQATVGGFKLTPYTVWSRGVGDLMISTEFTLKPDLLTYTVPNVEYRFQTRGWNATINSDGFDLARPVASKDILNATCRPVKCQCDPLDPFPNCLSQLAYLNLELGAGHVGEWWDIKDNCWKIL